MSCTQNHPYSQEEEVDFEVLLEMSEDDRESRLVLPTGASLTRARGGHWWETLPCYIVLPGMPYANAWLFCCSVCRMRHPHQVP